ncbi:MAG: hypothetical protein KAR42_05405 [candidate division Zixibacteria bacterium]|nr:hypothetical protein [candidate division Zixibacteria bacterium]
MRQIMLEKIKSIQSVLMILMTLGYLLTTHLSTIDSLKTALSSKANQADMLLLDKKLTRIEVKLEQAIITREEINDLLNSIDNRLLTRNERRNHSIERNSDGAKN